MSASMHVVAFKPADAKWKKMKAVYDACTAAETEVPDEVLEFFNHQPPDDAGVEVSEEELERLGALKEYKEGMVDGFDVTLAKLPKGVTTVRFYNSY